MTPSVRMASNISFCTEIQGIFASFMSRHFAHHTFMEGNFEADVELSLPFFLSHPKASINILLISSVK